MTRLNETRISAVLTERIGGTFSRTAAAAYHVEHGACVLVGLDAHVEVRSDDRAVSGRAVLVPPDVPFATCCPGPVVSYTIDPELCPRLAGAARATGLRALDGRAGCASLAPSMRIAPRSRVPTCSPASATRRWASSSAAPA
jgi:hypothetical protein